MFKNFWFQAHWLIGISAGIVLAIVGLTGGILSFETEIQQWLNRDVRMVEARAEPALTPDALIAAVAAQYPGRRVTAITLSGSATESARVTLAANETGGQAAGAPPGRGPRGETRYVDPYTGHVLEGDATRGQTFFRTTRSLHRWLVAGEFGNQQIGRQIVGASTLLCIVLALSGLYLRWPRHVTDWRAWFTFDPKLKGRSFLWHLHSVVGTWVLVGFLLMSFTGLYWSYEWYRNGLYAIAGVERPAARGPGPQAAGPAAGRERNANAAAEGAGPARQAGPDREGGTERPARAAPPPLDLGTVWIAFQDTTADYGYSTVTLTLPQEAGRPVDIRYVDLDPAHERAANTLAIDATTGSIVRHERYDDRRAGEKFMASIFPLHSGSFFGMPGLVLYMIASLAMPLFTITGWMLYLDRRKKKRAARAAESAAVPNKTGAIGPALGSESLLLGFASQAGFARQLAWQTAGSLQAAGFNVEVQPLEKIGQEDIKRAKRALFVVSTFGEGEPPDDARPFMRRLMGQTLPLGDMKFGLLALGDSQYKTFCEFGRSLEQWLRRQGAQPLFPTVEVDNGDPGALDRWRNSLGGLADGAKIAAWEEQPLHPWRLLERRLLNPGSVGGPTYHLALVPQDSALPEWAAGDIAEIQPGNSDVAIERALAAAGLDGQSRLDFDGRSQTFAEALRYRDLSGFAALEKHDAAALAALKPLPKREFSIASVPADGALHLVVRQAQLPDGALGLGSGWLTAHASVGTDIRLRIRANPGFHAPDDNRPLILVGNGTGIAGLRSLIKTRALHSSGRNWLIFGERNSACDFYYREEIERWQSQGVLERVDLAFSRDQAQRIYVQQRLREQADTLRSWLDAGAAIYVCGSLEGMAPGVDTALVEIIGLGAVERLAEAGRYRRDVY